MNGEARNADGHKDSCNYAVDLSKQFVTIASGGLAFAITLALAYPMSFGYWHLLSTILLFGVSIGFGLAFLMTVVGHINKLNNYDVYTPCPRLMILCQMLLLAGAIILIAVGTLRCVRSSHEPHSDESANLTIVAGSSRLEQRIEPTAKLKVLVSDSNGINITKEPRP